MHDVREHAGSLAVPVRHEPQRCTVSSAEVPPHEAVSCVACEDCGIGEFPAPRPIRQATDIGEGRQREHHSSFEIQGSSARFSTQAPEPSTQGLDVPLDAAGAPSRPLQRAAPNRPAGGPGTRTQATWSDPESESGRKPSPERDKRSNALILRLCLHRPAERCHAPTWTDRNRLVRGPARATAAPENQQPAGAGIRKFAVPKKLPGRNEPRAGGGDEGIRTLEAVSRLLP